MHKILFKTVNEGAPEETIAALEERFRIRLPQELKEFYRQHNGAVFSPGALSSPERCQLCYFYPIGQRDQENFPLSIDQLLEWQKMDNLIPMCYVPFCEDEAGNSYYVRVDQEGYGEIHYIVDFLDNDCIEGTGLAAGSFAEFMDKVAGTVEDR